MTHSALRTLNSAPVRVLVVDDSSFMRKSLAHMLGSDRAIEVVGTAADGEDAIEKVKQLRPDVVLLDIEMPGMDGLAATRKSKLVYGKHTTPWTPLPSPRE